MKISFKKSSSEESLEQSQVNEEEIQLMVHNNKYSELVTQCWDLVKSLSEAKINLQLKQQTMANLVSVGDTVKRLIANCA